MYRWLASLSNILNSLSDSYKNIEMKRMDRPHAMGVVIKQCVASNQLNEFTLIPIMQWGGSIKWGG